VGADRSSKRASYKGLATLNDRLYATDFHNNRVDVFDASFKLVTGGGGFRDAKLPKGYAPSGSRL
jgi:DNA-binding beta-propeller fold protein YncE